MKRIKSIILSLALAAMASMSVYAAQSKTVTVEGFVSNIDKCPLLVNGTPRYKVTVSIYDLDGKHDCETNAYYLDKTFTYEELKKEKYILFPDVMVKMTDNTNGDPTDERVVDVINVMP